MGLFGLNFNLLDQLSFYGAYHNNRWNQLIHFIFVPAIVWTLCVWLCYSGPLMPGYVYEPWLARLPPVGSLEPERFMIPNAAFLLVVGYSSYYTMLDCGAGLTWSIFVGLPCWIAATAFKVLVPHAAFWAIPVHVFAWYMQLHPGHAICEKRKPALLDSLAQAFALAPLFVWFELLFLLGYNRQLYKKLKNRVGKEIAAWKKDEAQRKAGRLPSTGATKAIKVS